PLPPPSLIMLISLALHDALPIYLANLAIVGNRQHQHLAVGRCANGGAVDGLQPGRRRARRQASQYQHAQPAVKWLHPALQLLSLPECLLYSDSWWPCTSGPPAIARHPCTRPRITTILATAESAMSRFLSWLSILVLALAAGCSDSDNPATDNSATDASPASTAPASNDAAAVTES